jgi:hypothetical protein
MSVGNKFVRVLNAIWSGPFSIGPLVQPVSVGSAILKIIEVLWKVSIVGLLFLLAAFVFFRTLEYFEEAANPSLGSQIVASAKYDPLACGKENPIAVKLENNSQSKLNSANVDIIITLTGRSTNLNKNPSVDWDLILDPGKSDILCYAIPQSVTENPIELEFSVDLWSVQ